jgi:copper homeostasis protein
MSSGRRVLFEVCVDTAAGAVAAREGGADRVELCANLLEGGVTPSAGAVQWVREQLEISVMVLVRPRGGDFVYSDGEMAVMLRDIAVMRELGVDGVVVGALGPDATIDLSRTRTLVEAAGPLQVTFHRAFDMCIDPRGGLEQLIELGVDRVLTSGQEDVALDGVELLADLVEQAGNRIRIMPGGGIVESDIRRVLELSKATEVHFAAGASRESSMQFRNTRCSMGCGTVPDEYELRITDPARVREFVEHATRETD